MRAALRAWHAISATPGVSAKSAGALALALRAARRKAGSLLDASPDALVRLGLTPALAAAAAERLRAAKPPLPGPAGARVLCPDDPAYPVRRLGRPAPLPVLLWVGGGVELLDRPSVAFFGARDSTEPALAWTGRLAGALARAGHVIVAGHLTRLDEEAHGAALQSGGATVAVLAEGLARFRRRDPLRGAPDDVLAAVSEFQPFSRWAPHREMERNATLAALGDAVVVVAEGRPGRNWSAGEQCLQMGVRVLVPDFPPSVAPGNRELIRAGGVPLPVDDLDAAVTQVVTPPAPAPAPSIFGS